MEKIKEFFTKHKKTIVISTAVIATIAAGAIAYKLHLSKDQVIETLDNADMEEVVIDTMKQAL